MEAGFSSGRKSAELHLESVLVRTRGEMAQVRDPLLGARGPAFPPNLMPLKYQPRVPPSPHTHGLHVPLHLSGGRLLLTWTSGPSQKRVRGDSPKAMWPDSKGEGRAPGPRANQDP